MRYALPSGPVTEVCTGLHGAVVSTQAAARFLRRRTDPLGRAVCRSRRALVDEPVVETDVGVEHAAVQLHLLLRHDGRVGGTRSAEDRQPPAWNIANIAMIAMLMTAIAMTNSTSRSRPRPSRSGRGRSLLGLGEALRLLWLGPGVDELERVAGTGSVVDEGRPACPSAGRSSCRLRTSRRRRRSSPPSASARRGRTAGRPSGTSSLTAARVRLPFIVIVAFVGGGAAVAAADPVSRCRPSILRHWLGAVAGRRRRARSQPRRSLVRSLRHERILRIEEAERAQLPLVGGGSAAALDRDAGEDRRRPRLRSLRRRSRCRSGLRSSDAAGGDGRRGLGRRPPRPAGRTCFISFGPWITATPSSARRRSRG